MQIRLKADFDAVVLCGGATVKRNIPIPGADLERRSSSNGVFKTEQSICRWVGRL